MDSCRRPHISPRRVSHSRSIHSSFSLLAVHTLAVMRGAEGHQASLTYRPQFISFFQKLFLEIAIPRTPSPAAGPRSWKRIQCSLWILRILVVYTSIVESGFQTSAVQPRGRFSILSSQNLNGSACVYTSAYFCCIASCHTLARTFYKLSCPMVLCGTDFG